jgi:hypothetical protein
VTHLRNVRFSGIEKKLKKSQDLHVNTEVGGIIIIVVVVSVTLQSSVDLGLPHNPPPVLSMLCLHLLTSDSHRPEVLLHVCCPSFSWLSSFSSCHRFLSSGSFCAYDDHQYVARDPASWPFLMWQWWQHVHPKTCYPPMEKPIQEGLHSDIEYSLIPLRLRKKLCDLWFTCNVAYRTCRSVVKWRAHTHTHTHTHTHISFIALLFVYYHVTVDKIYFLKKFIVRIYWRAF